MRKGTLLSAGITLLSLGGFGADACLDMHDRYPVDIQPSAGIVSTPEQGRWCDDFDATKAKSDELNVPMLVFLGNDGCPCCNYLTDTVINQKTFLDWAAQRKIFMVYVHYVNKQTPAYKNFFNVAPKYTETAMPAIGVYWPKSGAVEPLVSKFCGRDGRMPVTAGSLADQFIQSVETVIRDYSDGWRFAVGNTVGDRLEAESTTAFVDVPLVRSDATTGDAFKLKITYPSGSPEERTIAWGSAAMRVERVTIKGYAKGKSIGLRLTNTQSGAFEDSAITFVERENSPKNPTWKGVTEFGEWTMDLGAALDKVVQYKKTHPGAAAYTLALVAGGMWCPDCAKTDAYLIDTPEFKSWAAKNNVACVVVDIPNWSATAPDDGPCLLTREAKDVSQTYIDADPEHGPKQSGAGYLSRWMIDGNAAAAQLETNRKLIARNTLNGGWNRPERSNQYRTGVPIFILLNDDGSIAGRLETFASTSPTEFLQSNIDRLDDLLATAGGTEENMHWMTAVTPGCELDVRGAAKTGALSAVDTSDYWKLTGMKNWVRTDFTVKGGSRTGVEDVSVNLWKKASGDAVKVTSQTGNLARGVTLAGVEISKDAEFFVQVEAQPSSTTFAFDRSGSSVVDYTVTPRTVDDAGTVAFVTSGSTVKEDIGTVFVAIVRKDGASGATNVAVKVDGASDAETDRYELLDTSVSWSDGEMGEKSVRIRVIDDSNADGTQNVILRVGNSTYTLTINDNDRAAVGKLSIAETVPAKTAATKLVATEGTEVRIGVARIGGASGAVSARLSSTAGMWTDGDGVAWANRESGTVWHTLRMPTAAACPDGQVVVTLVDLAGGVSADSGTKKLTIELMRANVPQFEESEVTASLTRYVAFERTVGIKNLTSGGKTKLSKTSGKVPSGIKFAVEDGQLLISGVPTKAGFFEVVYQISETVGRVTTKGLTVKVSFTVTDIAALDPADPGANPSVAKSRTLSDIMVVDAAAKRLTGLLTVTIPATGRVSAKYRCADGTVSLSAKNWTGYDANTGALSTQLTVSKKEHWMNVTAKRDGMVDITLYDPNVGLLTASQADPWSAERSAAEWEGYYTADCYNPELTDGLALARGDVVFTLKMSGSSSANKGTVKFSGVLADGQGFSGSSTLVRTEDIDYVLLPIFYVSKQKELFSAAPRIKRNHPAQAVDSDEGFISTWWTHMEKSSAEAGYTMKFEGIAGSAYDSKADLVELAIADFETTEFILSAEDALDPVRVSVTSTKPVLDKDDAKGVSKPKLSFSRSTGMISGSFKTEDSTGKTVSASYKGVLLPGWGGCSSCSIDVVRPWAAGAFWLSDKLTGKDGRTTSVKTGGFLSIDKGDE